MTAADIQIFDENANPVKVPDAVRATLTPLQCELLDTVQATATVERTTTDRHAVALKRLYAAVRNRDAVETKRSEVLPKLNQQDLLRAMQMNH